MRVVAGSDGIRLDDADDTGSFSVQSPGGADAAAEALRERGDGGAADVDGHVVVTVDAVRRLADGQVDDGWSGRFEAMLAYARGKGWLTVDGAGILAHVEQDAGAGR